MSSETAHHVSHRIMGNEGVHKVPAPLSLTRKPTLLVSRLGCCSMQQLILSLYQEIS
jgi:hypothetical protein